MSQVNWHGKPYYSLDAWCKNHFSHKCYKIALNAHMTCPNRDGSLDTRGCIFCSAGGSGDFATAVSCGDIASQLDEGIQRISRKMPAPDGPCFIAYFQAYTNTYAPAAYLEQIFTEALSCEKVCGISIATRPDCLPPDVLALLARCRDAFPDKFLWVELGLQTIHPATADYIRRGFDLACFETAVRNLKALSIPVIVHTILGLPGESADAMYETISYVNELSPFGIKLQLLHVLTGTDLARDYLNGSFQVLDLDTYLDILTKCLGMLSPEIVVHRVTGDGPKHLLLAPAWSLNKRNVLNSLHARLREQAITQGCLYQRSSFL